MASNQPQAQQQPSTSASPSQEYIVRVSADVKKKQSIVKFNPANKVDFTKGTKVTLERENNFKEFKQAYDIDAMPKFGAGSEFGREAREEARRKKYGIKSKVYNPHDQPWQMKIGPDSKTARRFKGVKEGGVLENTSYYIFTQCPDGAFEAFPVQDWYNFTPIARYKVLNSEEAEKEYEKREERVNYFNIMVRKRMKAEDVDEDKEVDDDGKKVKKKKQKDFVLTELDEWAILSDDESGNESDQSGDGAEKKKKKEKESKKKPTKKRKKSGKKNSDDEAVEDSDDMDEGKEVDYMTSSDSDDDNMYADRSKVKSDKYDDKGVVEEDGLRKLIDSDEEDEDEKKNQDEDEKKDEDDEAETREKTKKGSDSESSESSDSDSDVEKDANFPSALFMKKSEAKASKKEGHSKDVTPTSSRSATPTVPGDDDKAKKRKATDVDGSSSKKPRVSAPAPSIGSSSDGITEDSVRRYLMRKPMTTKELLIKFRNTGLSKEQRVTQLAQILKKLNPDKKKIQDQLYLSIKKPE